MVVAHGQKFTQSLESERWKFLEMEGGQFEKKNQKRIGIDDVPSALCDKFSQTVSC